MFNPYADPTQTPFQEYNPNAIPEAYQEDMSKSPFQVAAPAEYDNQNIMKVDDGGPKTPGSLLIEGLTRMNGLPGITVKRRFNKRGDMDFTASIYGVGTFKASVSGLKANPKTKQLPSYDAQVSFYDTSGKLIYDNVAKDLDEAEAILGRIAKGLDYYHHDNEGVKKFKNSTRGKTLMNYPIFGRRFLSIQDGD